MKVCEALRHSVRLELNHIYTERPFQTPTGADMGWFCREHVLHVAALAGMLGDNAQLCCGDIIVRIPGHTTVSTVDSGSDHAWCRVNGKTPVDASMTLRYIAPQLTDVRAVCPDRPEDLAGFTLRYEIHTEDQLFAEYLHSSERLIAYNEKTVPAVNILDLLANPFSFLHRPLPGAPSFPEIHGPDVFFAITAHLYKLALGECRPLRTYRSPKDAVRAAIKHNPDARKFVESKLRGHAI